MRDSDRQTTRSVPSGDCMLMTHDARGSVVRAGMAGAVLPAHATHNVMAANIQQARWRRVKVIGAPVHVGSIVCVNETAPLQFTIAVRTR